MMLGCFWCGFLDLPQEVPRGTCQVTWCVAYGVFCFCNVSVFSWLDRWWIHYCCLWQCCKYSWRCVRWKGSCFKGIDWVMSIVEMYKISQKLLFCVWVFIERIFCSCVLFCWSWSWRWRLDDCDEAVFCACDCAKCLLVTARVLAGVVWLIFPC